MRTPFEQAALAYCAPRGIRLSEFLDLWSPGDQRSALEWQTEQNLKCPGCGQPVTECMVDEDDAPAYEVELRRCHACKAKGIEEREMSRDSDPDPGLYSIVRKVTDGRVDVAATNGSETRAAGR